MNTSKNYKGEPFLNEQYSKRAFIELALSCNVLKFGQFILKSGRPSPYFFNAGLFYQGKALQKLGEFYADLLIKSQVDCKQLFGPAYKGLPLATSTSIALAQRGIDSTVTFNRKEIKDHGEGGQLIGAPLTGNTVMIDDVITAGTAFRESHALIQENGGNLQTVIIALNRCEKGLGKLSAVEEIESKGIKVLSIINLADLIQYAENASWDKELDLLKKHQSEFGN
jgi:orotate phosphoribosyltransferase